VTALRITRYILWALVAVAVIVLALLGFNVFGGDEVVGTDQIVGTSDEPADASVTIGGPFALVTDDGEPITDIDLQGHPSLMFFGYTFCPDVCPTALTDVTAWLADLGDEAGNLAVYFVTVDPDRDQPERLHEYLSAFDPRIVGVTGPDDDVHAMLDSFHVYYERGDDIPGGGYLMNHYGSFYMLDSDGQFVGAIAYNEARGDAEAKIRSLVEGD
jgi:protein SCO1/2